MEGKEKAFKENLEKLGGLVQKIMQIDLATISLT
jgi:hypothetical protein